jgi:hypothetical protein
VLATCVAVQQTILPGSMLSVAVDVASPP